MPVRKWRVPNPLPAKITMANINRVLGFSSFILLASCLPAAEPVDDGSACLSSWHAYDSSSSSRESETFTTTLSTEALYPELDYDVPYTTLCDGYRRALVTRETTVYTTYDPPTTTTEHYTYTEPEPTCTIPESACTAIKAAYTSSLSDYQTNDGPSPAPTHCTTYVACDSYCRIHGGDAKVYYWPVTTQGGDFCTKSGTTVFAEPTSPPNPDTVVTDGYTFTSPTNYISFGYLEGISRTRKYGEVTTCGGTGYSNVIVPVTGPMTTKGLDGRESLNFEDLNTMKFEDFKAQRRCKNNPCTIIEDFYTPELALPTEVLDLEPKEWRDAGCSGTDVGTSYYHPQMVALVTPAPVATGKLL